MMTFQDIRESRGRLYQNGSQFARLLTDYYGRIAFPFVTIIMVLGRHRAQSSPKRHPRWQHGDRDRTSLAGRLLLLGCSLNCHCIRTWGRASTGNRRLVDERLVYQLWPVSHVETQVLSDAELTVAEASAQRDSVDARRRFR